MDFDVDSETPPSSPLIGYATTAGRDLLNAELAFECKGPIRSNDPSFSSNGVLGKGDLISTIKLLHNNLSFDYRFESEDTQYSFFNFTFNQTIENLRLFIQICRKNIATLENLVHQPAPLHTSDDNLKPWELRKEVGTFLNFILSQCNSFRQLDEEFVSLFKGLRNSLEKIEGWPSALKSHNGSPDGNKCQSPYYHYFHVNLELRWFFLILNGLDSATIDWILDDLIYLAWFMYACEKSDWNPRISQKNAFNCYCVKELWTMVIHVVNEIKPQGKEFWDFLTVALKRFDKNKVDILFPLWLIVKIAPLGKYSLTGQFTGLTSPNSSALDSSSSTNCYNFVKEFVKECLSANELKNNAGTTTSSEVMDLLYKLLPYWGSEEKIIHTLWDYWCGKICKEVGVQDFMYWKSPVKWLGLVKSIGDIDSKDNSYSTTSGTGGNVDSSLAKDEFLQFIRLFCSHVRYYKDHKKLLKLVTPIYIKLPNTKVSTFSEIGLIRLCSLHLGIICTAASTAKEEDVLSISKRCTTNLMDIYQVFTQKNNKLNSVRTIFTAQLTMILLLLDKSVHIGMIVNPFMERLNQLMLKQSQIQITNKKDLIMLYFECLDTLPKYGSTQDLDQHNFYSPHISIWLSAAGPDYINRTLRVLHTILLWLFNSNLQSSPVFARKILESAKQFLSEAVCRIQNRIPQTSDVEPLADLAADFTYLERNDGVMVKKLFEQFALEVRTSPEISQLYVEKVLHPEVENSQRIHVEDLQLLQSWIRLVCIGAKVPRQLTLEVLNKEKSYVVSQSNISLLTLFCKDANDNVDWERKDVDTILQPFLRLCEKKWNPLKSHVHIVESILQSAAIIMTEMKFQKIYVPKLPCVVQTILKTVTDYLVGMSLELENVLIDCLPKIFEAITCYQNWNNDPYLRSQAFYLLTFAFTCFARDNNLRNFEAHPAVKMLQSATNHYNDVVLSEFLPEMKSIVSDQKLSHHNEYLKTLSLFSRKKLGLISVIAKSLPMVLKITRLASNSNNDMNMCCDIICSIFDPAYGSGDDDSKESKNQFDFSFVDVDLALQSAIRNELDQNLSLHGRKYFSFFRKLFSHKTQFRDRLRRFLKDKLIPVMNEQIHLHEMKRGFGQDHALRTQCQSLEAEMNRLM